ncbi:hypothetical protein [Lentisalinibacter salinarum]|uniref:hypothetical protein n=1 Tax=Lentisalinibacter salinarum TaxID=2992239 RepID=UPI0038693E77
MNKKRIITNFALATITALALSGCNKITGGGWLEGIDGGLVSFGFNAQPVGEAPGECEFSPFGPSVACWPAKGHFNLIDHGSVSGKPMQIRGSFTGTYTGQSPLACEEQAPEVCGSIFTGEAVVDGYSYAMRLRITDNGQGSGTIGDFFELFLSPTNGGPQIGPYVSTIGGGNLKVHQ